MILKEEMTKNKLHRIEKAIMDVLVKENRAVSIKEISKKIGVSWVTVKKYILEMIKKGLIE